MGKVEVYYTVNRRVISTLLVAKLKQKFFPLRNDVVILFGAHMISPAQHCGLRISLSMIDKSCQYFYAVFADAIMCSRRMYELIELVSR